MHPRALRLAYLIAAICFGLARSVAADTVSIGSVVLVDTLGAATPETIFSTGGSSATPFYGLHGYGSKFTGPQFTLAEAAVLRSVGGFLNSCETVEGRAECPFAAGITVQIRPALENNPQYGPDPERLIATFPLSHDGNPFIYSFESASVWLRLDAGVYYALFALPPNQTGSILDGASHPFSYRAGETVFGDIDPGVGFSFQSSLRGAVLVTAEPVPEPGTLGLFVVAAIASASWWRRRWPTFSRLL